MKKKNKRKISEVNKKMTFSEIIQKNPKAAEILMKKGMHCIGCHMAIHETLEQGALMHNMDPDELVKEINKTKKKSKKK